MQSFNLITVFHWALTHQPCNYQSFKTHIVMAFRFATPQSSLEHYHHPSQKPNSPLYSPLHSQAWAVTKLSCLTDLLMLDTTVESCVCLPLFLPRLSRSVHGVECASPTFLFMAFAVLTCQSSGTSALASSCCWWCYCYQCCSHCLVIMSS